jgi:hypothetical protein
VGTAVVRRHHLYVSVLRLAITVLELDSCIRETHSVAIEGKVVLLRPCRNLFRRPVGSAGAVGPPPVPLLEEVLVLAFEFVVERDTPDAATLIPNLRLGISIGAVDLDVVGQFARLPEASVEDLPRPSGVLTPIRFEEVSTSVREYHNIVVPALQGDALQQAGCLEVIETLLRRPLASLLAENLLDVRDLDNAEGRDGRERVAFPAVQLVRPLPLAHDLALGPTRQVDVTCEQPALVVSPARTIATTARTPAAHLRIAAVPRFVIPRFVSIEHSSPFGR